ncbi:MAG: hypothetical protein NTV86_09745 [Planctomycetota bacterium]|nr:hypothetical protein [Planctomycetota bacterium]
MCPGVFVLCVRRVLAWAGVSLCLFTSVGCIQIPGPPYWFDNAWEVSTSCFQRSPDGNLGARVRCHYLNNGLACNVYPGGFSGPGTNTYYERQAYRLEIQWIPLDDPERIRTVQIRTEDKAKTGGLPRFFNPTVGLQFSPDSKRLACLQSDRLSMVDLETGTLSTVPLTDPTALALSWIRDDEQVYLTGSGVWKRSPRSSDAGERVCEAALGGNACLSPDGRFAIAHTPPDKNDCWHPVLVEMVNKKVHLYENLFGGWTIIPQYQYWNADGKSVLVTAHDTCIRINLETWEASQENRKSFEETIDPHEEKRAFPDPVRDPDSPMWPKLTADSAADLPGVVAGCAAADHLITDKMGGSVGFDGQMTLTEGKDSKGRRRVTGTGTIRGPKGTGRLEFRALAPSDKPPYRVRSLWVIYDSWSWPLVNLGADAPP